MTTHPARQDLVEALRVLCMPEAEMFSDSERVYRFIVASRVLIAALASEAASHEPADERLQRLEAAIEGELEGLAITRDQAINILVYVDTGLDLGIAAAIRSLPADKEGA